MTIDQAEFQALGRDNVNDVASILADDGRDFGTVAHETPVGGDAVFTWDYERSRAGLSKLYERAKTSQWNATTDLDWSTEVDVEAVATTMQAAAGPLLNRLRDLPNSPLQTWGPKEWSTLGVEAFRWRMSQFLHGEQGALICTAKIVETVPWIDAKYYAATQVVDEARHVEVFSRYLDTKLGGGFPVNPNLQLLIDDVIGDTRWDMTYMGMQIMIEGLALAAFGFMHAVTEEPLLKKLLRYVLSDEARHVAFGVLSLQEYYGGLSGPEIRERQEFAFEAALRMRDRLMMHTVWERCGVDRETITKMLFELRQPGVNPFQASLFAKIVPNCKKLGLLDAGDGWLRDRFTEIGVIDFENAPDTETEYELLDAVAADRAAT
ncbi:MAG TPA: ferritin-like domain-containing protein [Acidimicrobiia bacterium]